MTLDQEIVINDCPLMAQVTYYTSIEDDQCLIESVKLNDLIIDDVLALLGGVQLDDLTFSATEEFYASQRIAAE